MRKKIEDLNLPERIKRVLKTEGILYIDQLEKIDIDNLYYRPGIGKKSIEIIKKILKEINEENTETQFNLPSIKEQNPQKENELNSENIDSIDKNKIEILKLPARVQNLLKRYGIKYIYQLQGRSLEKLFNKPGFGKKAINNIKIALYNYERNKSMYTVEESQLVLKDKETLKKDTAKKFKEKDKENKKELIKILEILKDFLENNLTEKEKYIIINRAIKKKTLQEIGNELGITRERVRQLESSVLKRLIKHLESVQLSKDIFIFSVDKELFPDFEIIYILKKILEKEKKVFNIYEIDKKILIFNFSEKEYEERIKNLLFENGIPIRIKEIEYLLEENNIPIDFLNIVLSKLHAYIVNDTISYYKNLSKEKNIELILKKLNKPAHFSEVTKIFIELSGIETTEHNIESILQRNENIYQVDKGIFAHKNFVFTHISEDLISKIKNESYRLLTRLGTLTDTIYLLDELKGKFNLPEILNPYFLKSILKKDERFISGRKFEIGLKKFGRKRIDYEILILDVLNSASKPLSKEEIQEQLEKKKRKIPFSTINMVFNSSHEIIRTYENKYTTLSKLGITRENIKFFVENAKILLEKNKFPLALEYIAEKIKDFNPKYKFLNKYILYSIFKKQENFVVIPERLLSLKSIPFKNYEDIFEYILKKEGKPLKIKDILSIYKALTKEQNVSSNNFYNFLYQNSKFLTKDGFVYLQEWEERRNSGENVKSSNVKITHEYIKLYFMFKELSEESFSEEEEEEKEKYYKAVSIFKDNEPSDIEKLAWITYLIERKKPGDALKLIRYIDPENLPPESKRYFEEIKNMFG